MLQGNGMSERSVIQLCNALTNEELAQFATFVNAENARRQAESTALNGVAGPGKPATAA